MKRRFSLSLCALLLVSGCAHQTTTPPEPPADQTPPPIPYQGEDLADLLVAEVAAQRQQLEVTLGYYVSVAERIHDPRIVRQAAELAGYLGQHEQALSLSELWLEITPDNEAALQQATLSSIALSRPRAAAHYIDRLLATHDEQALARLVLQARGLDEKGNAQLVQALAQLSDRYPEQSPLWYAKALHLQQQNDLRGALQANERALEIMPEHKEALLLKGGLLFEQGEHRQALRHLRRLTRQFPDDRRIHINYIRMLLAAEETETAEEVLHELAEAYPDDLDLRYSLALLALEGGAPKSAQQQLQGLLRQGYRRNEMHLYLAQAAEQLDEMSTAIQHYLQVEGPQQLRAQVQAARLLYQQGAPRRAHKLISLLRERHPSHADSLTITEAEMRRQNDDPQGAMALLTRGIEQHPDNTELLYSRAMLAEKLNRIPLLETDLKRVLELKPGDATALNALGYTLADRTNRLDEAFNYIRQALEQRPDDPAILDSMGWVLYKQGKLKQARGYLRRAYEKFPDPEVAAHYGEVLWVLGAHNQARELWRDALATHPDAEPIVKTMQRLGAQL